MTREQEGNRRPRMVCWFSCGATSAVAAKLALSRHSRDYDVRVAYCDTGSEHPDNERFIQDCQRWFGQEIEIVRSEKYANIWDVFEKTRYLVGVAGARCTAELKKAVRFRYQQPDDIQVWGFDADEQKRVERFKANNPEIRIYLPLIEANLGKKDCLAIIEKAGIDLPTMYKLGYRNNNCIGCVKGQAGYWNKIRKDFPEIFERMAQVERDLNVAINKSYAGDGKRKRVFLDELPPMMGNYSAEESIECSLFCGAVADDLGIEA